MQVGRRSGGRKPPHSSERWHLSILSISPAFCVLLHRKLEHRSLTQERSGQGQQTLSPSPSVLRAPAEATGRNCRSPILSRARSWNSVQCNAAAEALDKSIRRCKPPPPHSVIPTWQPCSRGGTDTDCQRVGRCGLRPMPPSSAGLRAWRWTTTGSSVLSTFLRILPVKSRHGISTRFPLRPPKQRARFALASAVSAWCRPLRDWRCTWLCFLP